MRHSVMNQNATNWVELVVALRQKGWRIITPHTVANLAPDLRKVTVGGQTVDGGWLFTPGYPAEDPPLGDDDFQSWQDEPGY